MANILNKALLSVVSPVTFELIELLERQHLGYKAVPVGSFETSGGAYNDFDILLYEPVLPIAIATATRQSLLNRGFVQGGSFEDNPDPAFESFKTEGLNNYKPVNIIIVRNEEKFRQFWAAACLCKKLGLDSKEHRIAVHNALMRGEIDQNITRLI